MTTTPWSCCNLIVARGRLIGTRRRLYFLHSESCPQPLLRRATRTLWVEQPHLSYRVRERWPAA
jgi:hypothetical protein